MYTLIFADNEGIHYIQCPSLSVACTLEEAVQAHTRVTYTEILTPIAQSLRKWHKPTH